MNEALLALALTAAMFAAMVLVITGVVALSMILIAFWRGVLTGWWN